MNLVRLFLSLALWPGIFATAVFLHRLILGAWSNPNFPWMGSASFGVGILLAWAAFIFLPRPRGFYVLGHELTHALAVWFSGGRVHSLHVGDQGGKVVADRVSPWISLAPYIFPFYPLGAGILWLAGTRCCPEANHYAVPFLGIWGAIWGYHYAFTLSLIPTRQPDFLVYGRIFSFTLIALGNLFVAALLTWSTFRPSPAGQSLILLGSEWAWTYTQIAYRLSGLLLRYLPHPA